MKVIFICDWDFTNLWSVVAGDLLEKKVIDKCDALVVGKLWYQKLLSQKHCFENVWLLQDYVEDVNDVLLDESRLIELDKQYGNPTVWRYMWADRSWVNESYDNGVKLLVSAFDFFEKLYKKERPDLVVTCAYGSMPHVVGFSVAEKLGIPVLAALHSRFQSYLVPSYNPYENINWIDGYLTGANSVSATARSIASQYVVDFRKAPKKPDYEEIANRWHGVDFGYVYRFFRYCYRFYLDGTYSNDHTKKNPFKKLVMTITPKVARWYFNKMVVWDEWKSEESYIYFPMHVQPESSTMTLAPFYLNQVSVIENVAKAAPYGMRVVVKEHPQMVGNRKLEYYQRLRNIVNVDVVEPHTDNFKLIKNAKLIFTITGTAGLEGLMLEKPVITLGEVLYNKCSLVRQLKDIAPTQWSQQIKDMLDNYHHDEGVLIDYLSAIVENGSQMLCIEPDLAPDEVLSEKNINKISKFLSNEIAKLRQ